MGFQRSFEIIQPLRGWIDMIYDFATKIYPLRGFKNNFVEVALL